MIILSRVLSLNGHKLVGQNISDLNWNHTSQTFQMNQVNRLEEDFPEDVRIKYLDRTDSLTKNIDNRKTFSIKAKFGHYNTVVKSAEIYGFTLCRLSVALTQFEDRERELKLKILGNRRIDGQVLLNGNKNI